MATYTAGLALKVATEFKCFRPMIEDALRTAATGQGFIFSGDSFTRLEVPIGNRMVIGDVYDWAAANPTAPIDI